MERFFGCSTFKKGWSYYITDRLQLNIRSLTENIMVSIDVHLFRLVFIECFVYWSRKMRILLDAFKQGFLQELKQGFKNSAEAIGDVIINMPSVEQNDEFNASSLRLSTLPDSKI
jgi:hypothetical protein